MNDIKRIVSRLKCQYLKENNNKDYRNKFSLRFDDVLIKQDGYIAFNYRMLWFGRYDKSAMWHYCKDGKFTKLNIHLPKNY